MYIPFVKSLQKRKKKKLTSFRLIIRLRLNIYARFLLKFRNLYIIMSLLQWNERLQLILLVYIFNRFSTCMLFFLNLFKKKCINFFFFKYSKDKQISNAKHVNIF